MNTSRLAQGTFWLLFLLGSIGRHSVGETRSPRPYPTVSPNPMPTAPQIPISPSPIPGASVSPTPPSPNPKPPASPSPTPAIHGCSNGSCVPGGRGVYCQSGDDTPCLVKRCDDSGVCSLGGTKQGCATFADCKLGCSTEGQCVPGGTKGSCITGRDCQVLRCHSSVQGQECILGGEGRPCLDRNDCNHSTCGNFIQECLPSYYPSASNIECQNDAACAIVTNRCSTDGTAQCLPPPAQQGAPCQTDDQCGGLRCTGYVSRGKTCKTDGATCTKNEDCQFYRCNKGKCTMGSNYYGRPCSGNSESGYEECQAYTCEDLNPGNGELSKIVCVINHDGPASAKPCDPKADNPCGHKVCSSGQNEGEYTCINGPGAGHDECKTADDCPFVRKTSDDERRANSTRPPNSPHFASAGIGPFAGNEAEKPEVAIRLLGKLDGPRPTLGKKTAPVHMYLFQDLACGMCKNFYRKTMAEFEKLYLSKGKVYLTFVEFPLGMMAGSTRLAETALCAKDEGKYEQFLKLDLEDDANTEDFKIAEARVKVYKKKLGLNSARFNSCLKNHKYLPLIKEGFEIGEKLQVRGTPSYFINGKSKGGTKPFKDFQKLIEEALSAEQTRS